MTFDYAFTCARSGKKIRRYGWDKGRYCTCNKITAEPISFKWYPEGVSSTTIELDDVFEDDWEVIEDCPKEPDWSKR